MHLCHKFLISLLELESVCSFSSSTLKLRFSSVSSCGKQGDGSSVFARGDGSPCVSLQGANPPGLRGNPVSTVSPVGGWQWQHLVRQLRYVSAEEFFVVFF